MDIFICDWSDGSAEDWDYYFVLTGEVEMRLVYDNKFFIECNLPATFVYGAIYEKAKYSMPVFALLITMATNIIGFAFEE